MSFFAPVWYDKQRLGDDTISKFMRNLSTNAGLSKKYTNHCIRKTCIVTLDKSGFEARHIIALTSHKSEAIVKEYSENCLEEKREDMFDALSKQLVPNANTKFDVRSDYQNTDRVTTPTFALETFDTDPNEDAILEKFLQNTSHLDNNDLLLQLDTDRSNQIVPQTNAPQPLQPNQNFQNITQTFNAVPFKPFLPNMNFPNSNVTMNSNFYGNPR